MSGVTQSSDGLWHTSCGGTYRTEAAALHYEPLCQGVPLTTAYPPTATTGGPPVVHTGKSPGETPQLGIGSPLTAVLGVSTAQYLGWPILDWPIWLDILFFSALAVVVVLLIRKHRGGAK